MRIVLFLLIEKSQQRRNMTYFSADLIESQMLQFLIIKVYLIYEKKQWEQAKHTVKNLADFTEQRRLKGPCGLTSKEHTAIVHNLKYLGTF